MDIPSGISVKTYYFENDKCPTCERFNPILVGREIKNIRQTKHRKYKFLFQWGFFIKNHDPTPVYTRTLEEWKQAIGDGVIYDNYGTRYTWESFMQIVVAPLQKEADNPGFSKTADGYNFDSSTMFDDFDYSRH